MFLGDVVADGIFGVPAQTQNGSAVYPFFHIQTEPGTSQYFTMTFIVILMQVAMGIVHQFQLLSNVT